jgi:hypothetical protein
MPRTTLTCFPNPAAPKAGVLVIVLTFVIILTVLGYAPALALGIVVVATAVAVDPQLALNPGAGLIALGG